MVNSNVVVPTAAQARELADQAIENLLLLSSKEKEPTRADVMRTAVSDLKQVREALVAFEGEEKLHNMTCAELGNQLIGKLIRVLRKMHKNFPF